MATFLRLPDVMVRTALSRSAIYAAMASGTFPKPAKISARLNGWSATEISDWIASRIEAREAA